MAANPVLYFHPDAYRVARTDLKGRHSAGESLLTALIAQTPHTDIYALCQNVDEFREFASLVTESGRPLNAQAVSRLDFARLHAQGLLYLADPRVAELARARNIYSDTLYALCGVTHTISSRGVVDAIADLVTAPVMPWDALILTSHAVENAVTTVLEHAEERLRQRVGATRFVRPMLPVIPLGIHTQRFKRNQADRERWRKELGLDEATIVVLFFGRLSVHAKASPFQLAQAVERAARSGAERYAIIWAGWFNDDFQKRVFMETARKMAPSVAFHHVDGRQPDARFSIWSAADIFCSLSDNIQETFGLTVIEAMAAELPVIVSKWDGYRDTVRENVTGILVDSYMSGASLADLAYRYVSGVDSYDQYIGAISQFCFVDVEQTAQWISQLARDPHLRRTLAIAGRHSAEGEFDWTAVLPRYQELWNRQAEMLEQARRDKTTAQQLALDPGRMFAGYPSNHLEGNSLFARGPHFAYWEEIIRDPGIVIHAASLPSRTDFLAVRDRIAAAEAVSLNDLLSAVGPERRRVLLRGVHWMIKIGLLRLIAKR